MTVYMISSHHIGNILLALFILGQLLTACKAEKEMSTSPRNKVIIGYVPGFRGELDEKIIDAKKLTHINYAFVDVKDSMAWLTNMATDTINFRKLNSLKKVNPDLKILISIGGWGWSENFSDAVLTESSRRKFARTSVDIIKTYNLDGVDIDWEYPGMQGEDNVFREEDKENFTLMFKALREELDAVTSTSGKKYQLTTAVPEFEEFVNKTEMGKASQYLDYVNLMLYDFYVVRGDTVGHHANLYPSSNVAQRSGDIGIKRFVAAGVPVEKIVFGIPFYGRSWIVTTNDNHGIERMADSVVSAGGYSYIRDTMALMPGFKKYWDEQAKSPYLFNEDKRQLVVFDDERSVQLKCEYIRAHNLAGVMFWEYSSDPKLYLLNTVNEHLFK
jgi:chitinase